MLAVLISLLFIFAMGIEVRVEAKSCPFFHDALSNLLFKFLLTAFQLRLSHKILMRILRLTGSKHYVYNNQRSREEVVDEYYSTAG